MGAYGSHFLLLNLFRRNLMEDTKIITMPVIALRGLTMLPEMTISFDISRKKSIAAVEKAMVGDQRVRQYCP